MAEYTIYDIAKMAGVSASTVSRVINNRSGVKKETKERITRLLKQYNYVPNETARGLVNQSTKIIGVLIADIRTTHHTDAIYFIERELSKHGYCCLILNTGTNEHEQTHYIQLLNQRKVDAAIFIGSIYQTQSVRKAVLTYLPATPVVLFNGYLNAPNMYGVIADEKNGVSECVKLLAEKKRTHLAFVVDRDTPSNLLKQQGFEAGMALCCPGEPVYIQRIMETQDDAYHATRRLMQEHPEINGIIYTEDLLAAGGIRALYDLKLPIPERVAVIGINNSRYAQNSIPLMTSLDNMLYDLSLITVRNLMHILQGEQVNKKITLGTEIVVRQST